MTNENITITQEMAVVTVERLLYIHESAVRLNEVRRLCDEYCEKYLSLKRDIMEMCLIEPYLCEEDCDNFDAWCFALRDKEKLVSMGIKKDEQVCFVNSKKIQKMEKECESR